tara:strand:+ start:731 stop:1066 length:336 start_codon:yes stop_codon:yes gene_type:complete
MAISITWSIDQMVHNIADGGVFKVFWGVVGKNSEGPESASSGGQLLEEYNASSPLFVPYADLTQDEVLGWVWGTEGFDKVQIETTLTEKVQTQIDTATVEADGLPWTSAPD